MMMSFALPASCSGVTFEPRKEMKSARGRESVQQRPTGDRRQESGYARPLNGAEHRPSHASREERELTLTESTVLYRCGGLARTVKSAADPRKLAVRLNSC